MNLNFRMIGKIGFLLVIIGFFMPVACEMNGFDLASALMQGGSSIDGILLYVLFISAIVGVILGVLLMMKKSIPGAAEWVVLLVCVASGLIVFFRGIDTLTLNAGAYFILIGWICALITQLIPKKD
ncbi:MAG: hypothetical protein FWH41_06010 [Treponema sp.]|nr:hypothetical protein [Treponema sp.]MCL2139069.1 hypothetical protein [Treponema sp.]